MLPSINTRADLDALQGTPAHDQWLAVLAGSLWRLERDEAAQTWRAVQDDTQISRFGFSRSDFPSAQPPELPAFVPAAPAAPQSITRAQAKLALLQAGLLDSVQPAIDAIADPVQRAAAQIEWDDRLTFERNNPTLMTLATALGLTEEQLDALFAAGAAL